MSRDYSTALLEPRSARENYSTTRSQYATKKSPRVSVDVDELAREIGKYLEKTDISPKEYKVPGAE